MLKRIAQCTIVITIAVLATFAFLQRSKLIDYYVVSQNDLSPEVATIAKRLTLTDYGKFVLEASRPEIQPAAAFNQSCRDVHEQYQIVLGCYTARRIFIFDVTDSRLNGVKEVTTAHELLHGIFERLPAAEQQRLHDLLMAELPNITNQRINDTIQKYRETVPEHLGNELHSILGTEVAELSPELEKHYGRYFSDRKKVVQFSEQYEQVMAANTSAMKQYELQMNELKIEKEVLETNLASQQSEIIQLKNELQSLISNPVAYNQVGTRYNQLVQSYNSDVQSLKSMVRQYNELVQLHNELVLVQNELIEQLDSNHELLTN